MLAGKLKFYILVLFIFCYAGCTQQKLGEELSDEELISFVSTGNLRASIVKIDSVLKNENNTDHRRAILFYEKGTLLGRLEKDIEALGSLKEALFLFEKKNEKIFLAKTNMYLGDSYAHLSKLDTAANYTNTALKLYEEIGNKKGEAKALNSLGHLSFLKSDFTTSVLLVKKAIDIQSKLDDKETLAASYNNLGFILEQTEDYDQAMLNYQKAIEINREINRLDTNALRNLGYVHLIKNEPKKCIVIYKEALKIEEITEQYVFQKEIYDVLIEASLKDANYTSIARYISKKDSVNQLLTVYEEKEKTRLVNTKYEQFITQEKLKQELELNKKNKIILGSLLGLLLVFGLFLFQRNRNSRLRLNQEKLELEQKMLRTQMNPHFIFNTLTAIQKKVFDDDPIKSASYISQFAKLIRQNFDFVSKKEISLAEDIDALTNYIETQQFRFNNKFNYTINIDNDIDTTMIKIPPMLLQIFVENAIEHGLNPKIGQGQLDITISKENEFIKFEIIDDGVGYLEKETIGEHAITIFTKRLSLRKFGEEKLFSIESPGANLGTKVSILLKLE